MSEATTPQDPQDHRPDGLDDPETRQEVTEEIKEAAEAAFEGDPVAAVVMEDLVESAEGDPVRQEVLGDAVEEAIEEELERADAAS